MVIAEAPSGFSDSVDVGLLPDEIAKLYRQLAREDLPTHQSPQVAQGMPYISGETVVQVLNQVIGIHRWSFKMVEHGLNAESDEYWALGRLTIWFSIEQQPGSPIEPLMVREREIVHEQFGSSKVKRSRSTGAPVNLGFDQKAAGTEALKKCAAQIGIGLWLARKETAFWDAQEAGEPPKHGSANTRSQSGQSRPATTNNGSSAAASSANANGSTSSNSNGGAGSTGQSLVCEVCGSAILGQPKELGEDPWDAEKLAGFGKSKHGHATCWDHYRALKARKDNKPLPKGIGLPPENEWHINAQPGLPNTSGSSGAGTQTSSRPRPNADAAPKKTPADHMLDITNGLRNLASAKGDHRTQPAGPEQAEWALSVFYDVVGDLAAPMLRAIFGEGLSVADVDAIEEWMDKDQHWQTRLEAAAKALPQAAAA